MTTANGYAAAMASALGAYEALRPRSIQRTLGVSDVGYCHSQALWKMKGIEPTDAPNSRSALHGSALHELFVKARQASNPDLLHEVELKITLPSGLVLMGHADEVDPDEPSVTDFKTVGDDADLTVLRREGSSEQQRYQRHLYYFGAFQAGLVPEEGVVRNWWADRAGQNAWGHVEQEPFDMGLIYQADDWLQSIAYAAEHDEEVPRDKHHDYCRRFCPFFTHCRSGLSHDDAVITDPALIAAARRVHDGRAMEKEGKHTVEVGRRSLDVLKDSDPGDDVSAFLAGEWRIRWTSSMRAGSPVWRLAVDKVGDA